MALKINKGKGPSVTDFDKSQSTIGKTIVKYDGNSIITEKTDTDKSSPKFKVLPVQTQEK